MTRGAAIYTNNPSQNYFFLPILQTRKGYEDLRDTPRLPFGQGPSYQPELPDTGM